MSYEQRKQSIRQITRENFNTYTSHWANGDIDSQIFAEQLLENRNEIEEEDDEFYGIDKNQYIEIIDQEYDSYFFDNEWNPIF